MAMSFKSLKVMVTGAGGGIGRQLSISYAEQGADVILIDKSVAALAETVKQIREAGAEPLFHAVDLSDPHAIEACFKRLQESVGELHILINNAGFGIWKSPYDLTVDEWDRVVNTNLRGTFLCSREAARMMRGSGGGSIVNIASTRALMSEPNSEAYAASKGGILALTHSLSVSLGPQRIRVNAISPGWIETRNYEELKDTDHGQHPAQRVGKPEDIVRACFYLTDPGNDFVTGINLVVDGGMTRKMMYEE
jgi:NAD(P)-dependent dehydrogenase (short-subunit alcohol dehydrogenase family)